MKKTRLRLLPLILLFICIFSFPTYCNPYAPGANVLVLSGYSYGNYATREKLEGIASVNTSCNLSYAFMDKDILPNATSNATFEKLLQEKTSQKNGFDIVIVLDNYALDYVLSHRSTTAMNIPCIYIGVTDDKLVEKAKKDAKIIGIQELQDFHSPIKFIQKAFPNQNGIVAITDYSKDSAAALTDLQSTAISNGLPIRIIDATQYTQEGLKSELKKITPQEIVFYLGFYHDSSNTYYNTETALRLLEDNTESPIFTLDLGKDFNTVASMSVDYKKMGADSIRAVNSMANGTLIKKVRLASKSTAKYIFNDKLLQKYNISNGSLPQNSSIAHNGWLYFIPLRQIGTALAVIITLALIAILLVRRSQSSKKNQ